MLKELYIKNYALIDEMRIKFGPGLNIITGETGAGKSIILGALGLLLGDKTKTDVIRKGASMTIVEGIFDDNFNFDHIFKEQVNNHESGLLLRREIYDSGRSRSFANDSPISLSSLSQIGDLLIDLHGQHAHQTILKIDRHINYLDNFGVDIELRIQVKELYKKYRSLSEELNNLKNKEELLKEKKELLQFQVQEISRINPLDGEEENLEKEEHLLRNSEKFFKAAEQLDTLLYAGEASAVEKLSASENILVMLSSLDSSFEKILKDCESARIIAEEIINNVQGFISKIEFNPQKLEEIRERLGIFSHLKKKYGPSMENVIEFWKQTEQELENIETMHDDIDRINNSLEEIKKELSLLCGRLSDKREETSKRLEKSIIDAINELGLEKAVFIINLKKIESADGPIQLDNKHFKISQNGIDSAEFLISLNPGEDPKQLSKVVSGGEVSRIMLALKTVLADADEVPVLVFDEIDTGISGRIARVVGRNLKEVSNKHQVICITHLPQIASMADFHFSVEKKLQENRTQTIIRNLSKEEQISEIAKLLGGEHITESTIQNARELLNY
jgi:DNA repair protein RecN (Recombination protein N)